MNGGQLKGLKRVLTIKLSAAMNFKWYDHRDYVWSLSKVKPTAILVSECLN